MVSAPGAWRYKILPGSFGAEQAQFWLYFGVCGGHWLDEERLLVQERYPKAAPKSKRKKVNKIHTETSSKQSQNEYKNRRFFNLDCKGH